tara:strand:+ start:1121 stop:1891 length:771 start_codon:yes stop_codon:yes gene_type:complete
LFERFVIALVLQSEELPETANGLGGGIFELIARSSLISQGVLLLLLLFSVASWAIIAHKLREFKRVETDTKRFIEIFRKSSKFSEVHTVCKSLSASPLVGVFQAGYIELNAQLRQSDSPSPPDAGTDAATSRPSLRSFEALDRSLMRASNVEVNRLERYVQLLATTASVSPFIGLFGTVVGIIISFQSIGETGSTNLAVVAPGIAEALIATAAGLFAAIPAAYFYNHLTHKVKLAASSIDDFSLEFLNIAERNFAD